MEPNFNICDVCKKNHVEKHQRIYIAYDTQVDAAGDTDDVGENVDLCPRCMRMLLLSIVKDRSMGRLIMSHLGKIPILLGLLGCTPVTCRTETVILPGTVTNKEYEAAWSEEVYTPDISVDSEGYVTLTPNWSTEHHPEKHCLTIFLDKDIDGHRAELGKPSVEVNNKDIYSSYSPGDRVFVKFEYQYRRIGERQEDFWHGKVLEVNPERIENEQ